MLNRRINNEQQYNYTAQQISIQHFDATCCVTGVNKLYQNAELGTIIQYEHNTQLRPGVFKAH